MLFPPRNAIQGGLLVLTATLFASGCTFYTQCPPSNGNGNAAGAGGMGEAGGGQGNGTAGGAPIPTGEWTNASANLAGIPSECGNMSGLSAKPDEDLLIAGIAQNGLWVSSDGGGDFSQLGTGKDSASIANRMTTIVYDPDDTQRWWELGIYSVEGFFETTDNGKNFKLFPAAPGGDFVSIDLADPDRQTMLIGGHETPRALDISRDGGETWTSIGKGLPDGTNCTHPVLIDPQTFLVGCGGYGGGPSGVYRSVDGGVKWTVASKDGGYGTPMRASDDSIYWLSPNGALTRSTDDGKTWKLATESGVLVGPTLVELPDGRIASLSKRYVMISDDLGKTWLPASSQMPYDDSNPAVGLVYSVQQRAFFIWHSSCGFDGPVPVPDDAIMRYDFDYEAP